MSFLVNFLTDHNSFGVRPLEGVRRSSAISDVEKNEEKQLAFDGIEERNDVLTISDEAKTQNEEKDKKESGKEETTSEQKQEVDELKKRDQEVRTHEAAHIAAGGAYVKGGASYSYQQGSDGKRYAVGGEVQIDISAVSGNPQATISKMQTVRAAAMAPGEPSGADRSVAASASSQESQARRELAEEETEGSTKDGKTSEDINVNRKYGEELVKTGVNLDLSA